jgi:hypothetical protein
MPEDLAETTASRYRASCQVNFQNLPAWSQIWEVFFNASSFG